MSIKQKLLIYSKKKKRHCNLQHKVVSNRAKVFQEVFVGDDWCGDMWCRLWLVWWHVWCRLCVCLCAQNQGCNGAQGCNTGKNCQKPLNLLHIWFWIYFWSLHIQKHFTIPNGFFFLNKNTFSYVTPYAVHTSEAVVNTLWFLSILLLVFGVFFFFFFLN